MCGRFYLLTDLSLILGRFGAEGGALAAGVTGDFVPSTPVLAIRQEGDRRLAQTLRWGLVPAWAKDPAIGRQLFNARAETLSEKPSFRQAFERRRCLIPADGFYEWTGPKGAKQAYRFSLRDREPFAFAGLYETWRPPAGETVTTCTIVTTTANDLIAPLHDRMPVILTRDGEGLWLDPAVRDPALLQKLLSPYPAAAMAGEPLPQPPRGPR